MVVGQSWKFVEIDTLIVSFGVLKQLLCVSLQENYFGEDDMYTDFEESLSSPVLSTCSSSSCWTGVGLEDKSSKDAPHPLTLRPWDITVFINLHKVHGRLPTVSIASEEISNSIQKAIYSQSLRAIDKMLSCERPISGAVTSVSVE